jgi:hypothetical protein
VFGFRSRFERRERRPATIPANFRWKLAGMEELVGRARRSKRRFSIRRGASTAYTTSANFFNSSAMVPSSASPSASSF